MQFRLLLFLPVGIDQVFKDYQGRFQALAGRGDDLFVAPFHIAGRIDTRNIGPMARIPLDKSFLCQFDAGRPVLVRPPDA